MCSLTGYSNFNTAKSSLCKYEIPFVIILCSLVSYGKIPKISPGAYIFQRPFLRGSILEGLIFGGAYVWREICTSKSFGLACIRGQIPSTIPLGGLIFRGVYTWRGLFSEFYRIFLQVILLLEAACVRTDRYCLPLQKFHCFSPPTCRNYKFEHFFCFQCTLGFSNLRSANRKGYTATDPTLSGHPFLKRV